MNKFGGIYLDNKKIEPNQSKRILDATLKCVSLNGYANVSLRDIADEAGVVLSQLNYYYKNKEGLFVEVVKMVSQRYMKEIEENLKKGKSEKEKISFLIKYFQGMLKNNPELFKILFDLTSMSLWSKVLKELLDNLFNDLANLIKKYIMDNYSKKKILKNYSSEALSKMILGTLFGTSIQVMLSKGEEDMTDSLSSLEMFFAQ
jgi:AcrR family transcriptional regulator